METRNALQGNGARLARVQALSGLLFGLFATAHLLNAMFAIGGPQAYDGMQGALSAVYQWPLIEIGLFVALGVHVGTGIVRGRRRRASSNGRRASWPEHVHRGTGYALAVVVVLHVLATRGPALLAGADLAFGGVAFSLWYNPAVYYPYYLLFSAAALYHLGFGTHRALRIMGVRLPRVPRPIGLGAWGVTTVLILVALLGFGGVLRPIPDPTDNEYARFWEEHMGVELPERRAQAEQAKQAK